MAYTLACVYPQGLSVSDLPVACCKGQLSFLVLAYPYPSDIACGVGDSLSLCLTTPSRVHLHSGSMIYIHTHYLTSSSSPKSRYFIWLVCAGSFPFYISFSFL